MMKIDKITDNCCGCRLCEEICPQKAIEFVLNEEGFFYPFVSDQCIGCKKCVSLCPINQKGANSISFEGYMSFSADDDIRKNGSSGGVFGLLAKSVITEGGIVFGAAFDENLKLVTKFAETENELNRLYKSKYLQCDTTGLYKRVENEVRSGRKVLVCNTPCNNAALKNYLKKEYENLLLVDFVCHGVPSQDFFDKCIDWYKRKRKIEVYEYKFREKTKKSVTPHLLKLKYIKKGKEKEKVMLYLNDPYYLAFQKRISIRQSCYDCGFATDKRISDITIGDFHDIDKFTNKYDRMKGISMVLINSSKGLKAFEAIKENLVFEKFPVETLVENNECLKIPTKKPKERDKFFINLSGLGIDYVIKTELNSKREWKKTLYYSIPKSARKLIKKIVIGE